MNALRLLPVFLGATLACAAEPAPTNIGELPGQKVPVAVTPKDRNPFVRREAKAAQVQTDTESEESRLRAAFAGMAVRGIIRGSEGTKVLLESLVLRENAPVPPILEDQTEQLMVGRITDKQIELLFVEAEERAEPRRIVVPIDLTPRVRVRRPLTDAPAPSAGPPRSGGGTMRATAADGSVTVRSSSTP